MAASVCQRCGITFPDHHKTCLVTECRSPLLFSPVGKADLDWSEQVMKRNMQGGAAIITDHHGQTWLSDEDANLLGYTMALGAILELAGDFYEVNGRHRDNGWWVGKIVIEGAAESLEPRMFRGA